MVKLEKGKCLRTSSGLSSFPLGEWDFCSGELLILVCRLNILYFSGKGGLFEEEWAMVKDFQEG